jgi:hypothetical protein
MDVLVALSESHSTPSHSIGLRTIHRCPQQTGSTATERTTVKRLVLCVPVCL